MNITYLHHSGFLVETDRAYYLFDYENGALPPMDGEKQVYVLASHSHGDHYNRKIFPLLRQAGMARITAVLSDDIEIPADVPTLQVSPNRGYRLADQLTVTTFRSTDLGVAFLVEDREQLFYHAGDLNDWVWEEESDAYNREMTANYAEQIRLLSGKLGSRILDAAFVVLDPRQEQDYDRGMCFFLTHIAAKQVYPMHYWDNPGIIDTFLQEHPEYASVIRRTE